MNKPCDFHNKAMFDISAIETRAAVRMDGLESYLKMMHDQISILTKRVEQLELDKK